MMISHYWDFRWLALLFLGAFGCSVGNDVQRVAPPVADARARDYLRLVARGKLDSASRLLTPVLQTAATSQELARISALLAQSSTDSMRLVGVNVTNWPKARRTSLTYEVIARKSWAVASVATLDSGGHWMIEGASAQALDHPLEASTQFSLWGKSPIEYGWLLLTVMCAVISLGTCAWVATRRRMPLNWFWAIVSLVGVGAFRLDWATSQIEINFLSLQVFAVSFGHNGPYAPWIITFAVPVGALISLNRYHVWASQSVRRVEASTV